MRAILIRPIFYLLFRQNWGETIPISVNLLFTPDGDGQLQIKQHGRWVINKVRDLIFQGVTNCNTLRNSLNSKNPNLIGKSRGTYGFLESPRFLVFQCVTNCDTLKSSNRDLQVDIQKSNKFLEFFKFSDPFPPSILKSRDCVLVPNEVPYPCAGWVPPVFSGGTQQPPFSKYSFPLFLPRSLVYYFVHSSGQRTLSQQFVLRSVSLFGICICVQIPKSASNTCVDVPNCFL